MILIDRLILATLKLPMLAACFILSLSNCCLEDFVVDRVWRVRLFSSLMGRFWQASSIARFHSLATASVGAASEISSLLFLRTNAYHLCEKPLLPRTLSATGLETSRVLSSCVLFFVTEGYFGFCKRKPVTERVVLCL